MHLPVCNWPPHLCALPEWPAMQGAVRWQWGACDLCLPQEAGGPHRTQTGTHCSSAPADSYEWLSPPGSAHRFQDQSRDLGHSRKRLTVQDPVSRASTPRSQRPVSEDPVTCQGSFSNLTGPLTPDSTAPEVPSVPREKVVEFAEKLAVFFNV